MKQTQTYNIHFVCRGNSYRSRLAEAYARSLGLKGFKFSSSGIHTLAQPSVNFSPYTTRLLKKHSLVSHAAPEKRQTSTPILTAQDVVIFMSKDVFDEAQQMYVFDARKTILWHIDDVWQHGLKVGVPHEDNERITALTEQTFKRLQSHIDTLMHEFTTTPWAEAYNKENQPLGYRLPLTRIGQLGLWHRGVHAVITTQDKRILTEKRSATITFSPNLLDISMGGGVDPGESQQQALQREIAEELGIHVTPAQIRPIGLYRMSSYHRHLKRNWRTFSYVFQVSLPVPHDELKPVLQLSETQSVRFLTHRQTRRLLRLHRLPGFGALNYTYAFYAAILKGIK